MRVRIATGPMASVNAKNHLGQQCNERPKDQEDDAVPRENKIDATTRSIRHMPASPQRVFEHFDSLWSLAASREPNTVAGAESVELTAALRNIAAMPS